MANGNSEGKFFFLFFFQIGAKPNPDAKNQHIYKILKKARSDYHFRRKWETQTRGWGCVCVCVGGGGGELELN